MIHTHIILEDTILTCTDLPNGLIEADAEGNKASLFQVTAVDQMTGVTGTCRWTMKQWLAVNTLALGLAEEEGMLTEAVTKSLYEIAEPAVALLPPECRPIP